METGFETIPESQDTFLQMHLKIEDIGQSYTSCRDPLLTQLTTYSQLKFTAAMICPSHNKELKDCKIRMRERIPTMNGHMNTKLPLQKKRRETAFST